MKIQQSYEKQDSQPEAGELYLVATPVGNLEDMTYRAVRILSEVDFIACEDTRRTLKLLSHFQIKNRLFSYHEHNMRNSGPELIRRLKSGEKGALVSDAGMPAISDPGYELVKEAIEEGIKVIPIPGANAALTALVASGLPTDRFTFIGFLPRDQKAAEQLLTELQFRKETLIFYEAPHRLMKTLHLMAAVWHPERRIVLAREITKRYEEWARGTLAACIAYLEEHPPVGEYCVLIEGHDKEHSEQEENRWWQLMSVEEHYQAYCSRGLDRKEALKAVAKDRGVSKRDVYAVLHGKDTQ